MKLIREELNYFEEVGRIVSVARRLAEQKIRVVFQPEGMRVSATFDNSVRQEYYHTAAELEAYLMGLEDGYFHNKEISGALFTDREKA